MAGRRGMRSFRRRSCGRRRPGSARSPSASSSRSLVLALDRRVALRRRSRRSSTARSARSSRSRRRPLKAIPLALTGLAVALCLRMRLWNIGAEGQLHAGAIGATWAALTFPGGRRVLSCPRWCSPRWSPARSGRSWRRFRARSGGVNEIITTLLLNYVAILAVAYLVTGPWRSAATSLNFPVTNLFARGAVLPRSAQPHPHRRLLPARRRRRPARPPPPLALGLRGADDRREPGRGAASPACRPPGTSSSSCSSPGRIAGVAGHDRGVDDVRAAAPGHQPRLRLHGDRDRGARRREPRRDARRRVPLRRLRRRRARPPGARGTAGVRAPAAGDHPLLRARRRRRGCALTSWIPAASPRRSAGAPSRGGAVHHSDHAPDRGRRVPAHALLFAALGELVAERAGVINLGVEGMMLVGAVSASSPWTRPARSARRARRARGRRGVLAAASTPSSPSRCARTRSSAGSGSRSPARGSRRSSAARSSASRPRTSFDESTGRCLGSIPGLGEILFEQHALVYVGYVLAPVVWLSLARTRSGLHLRAVGENPAAADAMGVSVAALPLRRGRSSAGRWPASPAPLSLAESPGWSEGMTAGRGWIALALVIFATWSPLRLLPGRLLLRRPRRARLPRPDHRRRRPADDPRDDPLRGRRSSCSSS